jgi:Fe2+ or Zn2+ uptake regulation protein
MNIAMHNEGFEAICQRALKQDGARLTHARLAVIGALAETTRPLSPKDVLSEVKRRSPGEPVDLVSIYRTLEKLRQLELVHRVAPHGAFLPCRHASCGHERHVMMHCRNCAQTKECDIPEAAIRPLLRFLSERWQFGADSHAFQIDGVCEECRGS